MLVKVKHVGYSAQSVFLLENLINVDFFKHRGQFVFSLVQQLGDLLYNVVVDRYLTHGHVFETRKTALLRLQPHPLQDLLPAGLGVVFKFKVSFLEFKRGGSFVAERVKRVHEVLRHFDLALVELTAKLFNLENGIQLHAFLI